MDGHLFNTVTLLLRPLVCPLLIAHSIFIRIDPISTVHWLIQGECKTRWNKINTDNQGTCQSVCIMRVSILSGPSDVKSTTQLSIDKKTKAVIFTATKCLNCTLALTSLNCRNLITVIYVQAFKWKR